jgi:hypothetical protein
MSDPQAINGDDGPQALAPLDRLVIGYLALPLFIFLIGWFEWWAAVILVACAAYALRPLLMHRFGPMRPALTPQQIAIAVLIGCAWTVLGGTDHVFFANSDWHVRDAVLHDLVVSRWPVGYGLHDGQETMLRAPLGFYLPAALLGKVSTLPVAHVALLAWTAAGSIMFLLQSISLVKSRASAALLAAAVVVFFSGADIVGNLLNDGPRFRSQWDLPMHLEWWAGSYQYSSMTTQLFWVPNHALGGWLIIGLLYRLDAKTDLTLLLPILTVAAALWSPLTALGLVPFAIHRAAQDIFGRKSVRLFHPRIWLPALIVGLVVSAYLTMSVGSVPRGSAISPFTSDDGVMSILRQAQFFILEAGLIGVAILFIGPSTELMIALAVLAILPAVRFGPGNDLVMRASIPALTVVAICAFLALLDDKPRPRMLQKKAWLAGLLLVGAVTPLAELARAVIFPVWPINFQATLIGANCGGFAPHYVADLGGQAIVNLLRRPSRMALGPLGPESCANPASEIVLRRYPL